MHICLVNSEYPRETQFGGIATYQELLACNLIKENCFVTVVAASLEKNQDYYDNGIHVIRIFRKLKDETVDDYISYRKRVAETITNINNNYKIDVIETPEFGAETIYFDNEKYNIPIVVKLHTSYKIWSYYNKIKHQDVNVHNLVIKQEEEVLLKANKIISCSNLLKELMPKFYKKLDINKIEVVPNPININSFYPTKYNHNSKTVLFCGSIERRKGVYTLASAIPIVLDKFKKIKFIFVGNYQNSENSKDRIYKIIPKKYHNNIEFLGNVPNNELNKYYNDAFIGIVPSLFDNFPYVALEQMLCELPIIASNNTGVKEMIKDNYSGLLFEPNNYKELALKIMFLLENENIAKKIGKMARKKIIKNYNPNVIIKTNIKIYKRTIYDYEKKEKNAYMFSEY
ncbi:MAG: glycosyltransferase family 4 protein [Mollicutes bacterium]|nr:glycosyltransferase family 4 protein [Mollicutes bacterium]